MPNKFSEEQGDFEILSDDEKRALVDRVEHSSALYHSHALRAFLTYVAERTLARDFNALKEQQIGSQVLGRRSDYDPAEDNIVRVRARQLRQKLDEYFAGEGQAEPIVLSIPKGHYVSVFEARVDPHKRPRNAVAAVDAPAVGPLLDAPDDASQTTKIDDQPSLERKVHRWRMPSVVPTVVAVLAVSALCAVLLTRKDGAPRPVQESGVEPNYGLWSQFFPARGQELVVVTADSGAALWQDITHHSLALGDYVSRKYLQDQLGSPEMREIATRRYTSPTDVGVSLRLAEIARAFGGRVKAEFARSMDIHDLRGGNIVLLGSRRSNPWVELFEPQMNFVLDVNGHVGGPSFKNRAPQAGEPAKYSIEGTYLVVEGAEDKAVGSYAVAALLPSASGRGKILILEGLNMEGTEAAAEFVTNPDRFNTLLRKLGLSKEARLKSFEVLLKLTSIGGGYANPEIVAYRYSR